MFIVLYPSVVKRAAISVAQACTGREKKDCHSERSEETLRASLHSLNIEEIFFAALRMTTRFFFAACFVAGAARSI
jgi:hypothetical protein